MNPEAEELVNEYRKILKEALRQKRQFINVDEFFKFDGKLKDEIEYKEEIEAKLRFDCSNCKHEIYFSFIEDEYGYFYRDCLLMETVEILDEKIMFKKRRDEIDPISCRYHELKS